jgi:hypothetical protein
MRASDSIKSTLGRRIRNRDDTAKIDPKRSPMFQSTIANGMNASGFRSVGASCTGTKEVIFEANTGETEEIHRQRKFASAGHCNFDDIELQFRIFEYLARIERL